MNIKIDGVEYSICRVMAETVFLRYYFVFSEGVTGSEELVGKMFRYSGSNFLIEKVSLDSILVRLYLGE